MQNNDDINRDISELFAEIFIEHLKNLDENENDEYNDIVTNMVSFISVSLVKSDGGFNNFKLLEKMASMTEEEARMVFEKADHFFEEVGPNMGIVLLPCIFMHENDTLIQLFSSGFDINSNDIKNIVNSLINTVFYEDNSIQRGGASFKYFAKVALFIVTIFATMYLDYIFINNISAIKEKTSRTTSVTLIKSIYTYMTEKNICDIEPPENPQWKRIIESISKIYNITIPDKIARELNCLKERQDDAIYAFLNLNVGPQETNNFQNFSNELTLLNQDNSLVSIAALQNNEEKKKLENLKTKLQEKYSSFKTIEEYEAYLNKVTTQSFDSYIAEMEQYALTPSGYEFQEEEKKEEETLIIKEPNLWQQIKSSEIWQKISDRFELASALTNYILSEALSHARITGNAVSITPWRAYLRALRDYQMSQKFKLKEKKLEIEKTLEIVYNEIGDFIQDLNDIYYWFWIYAALNITLGTFVLKILWLYFRMKKSRSAEIESGVMMIQDVSQEQGQEMLENTNKGGRGRTKKRKKNVARHKNTLKQKKEKNKKQKSYKKRKNTHKKKRSIKRKMR